MTDILHDDIDANILRDIDAEEITAEDLPPDEKGDHKQDGGGLGEIVDQLNKRYFVVNEAGSVAVWERVYDPALKRQVLVRFSFGDFQKLYLNRFHTEWYNDKPVRKTIANWWLMNARRRQYIAGVTFDPTGNAPPDFLNLWSGFSVEPMVGDWSRMRNHIRVVICRGNEERFNYLFNWLARLFQLPNCPGEVAIVLKGKKGCGKGIFGRWVVRAWGQHGIHISSGNHLVGRFNAHLRDAVVVFADEAFFAGDRQHEGVLKALVTEPTVIVEGKFKDAVQAPNMMHIIMASNEEWVVPASADERRYDTYDLPDTYIGNHAYFAAIDEQMENGGLAAMIHELQNREIGEFNVRAVPYSDALEEQKMHSLDNLDKWLLEVLERGYVYRSRFGLAAFDQWYEFAATDLLERSYQQWAGDNRIGRLASRVQLGIRLSKIYQDGRPRGDEITGEVEAAPFGVNDRDNLIRRKSRPHGYQLGALENARAAFTDKRGVCGPSWRAES
jgi:hypothetical protein